MLILNILIFILQKNHCAEESKSLWIPPMKSTSPDYIKIISSDWTSTQCPHPLWLPQVPIWCCVSLLPPQSINVTVPSLCSVPEWALAPPSSTGVMPPSLPPSLQLCFSSTCWAPHLLGLNLTQHISARALGAAPSSAAGNSVRVLNEGGKLDSNYFSLDRLERPLIVTHLCSEASLTCKKSQVLDVK